MADQFDFFGGIDFSGAREPLSNLWSAIGRESGGKLQIIAIRPHAFRADLAGYVRGGWRGSDGGQGRILWGADFPFGLPREVSSAVGAGEAWAKITAWVADRPAEEIRDAAGPAAKAARVTDFGGAMSPLDLRLYKQTVEGIRWLTELRDYEDLSMSIHPLEVQPHASTTLVEVYPSGAASELGLPRRRAPGRPGEAKARAAALRTFLDFADPTTEALAVTLEDAWDATIACLTAFLCRNHLDQPFSDARFDHERLRQEGWIYRPPESLVTAGSAR